MTAPPAALVGRERELAILTGLLDRGGSRSAAAEVVADAGMGKTSLLAAVAAAAAARGHHVLALDVTEAEQGLPWAGMVSLHRSLPADATDSLADVQRRALASALGEGAPDVATAGPYVGVAVREIVQRLASDAPVTLLVDDLQWLDAATSGALAVAIRGSADLPFVVVAASRPVAVPLELERIVAHDVLRVELGGLGEGDVHQLLRERIGSRLTGSMLDTVSRLSGGNPLYTVLLGEHLATGGDGDLPRSIVGSYARRLDGLPPDVVEVLEHAALLGRADADVLTAVCPDLDVAAALLAAERAGLLVGGTQFVHPLLPTALTSRLGALGRERIHRRLAAALDDTERRAVHLAAAATGPDATVAAALDIAAVSALASGARIEAARHFERAAELTPADDIAARWGRELGAADAYLGGGDLQRAATHAASAVDLAAAPFELALSGGVMVQVIASRDGLHPAHDYVCDLLDRLEGEPFLRTFLSRARVRIEQTFDLHAALRTAKDSASELSSAGDARGAEVASVIAENCRFLLGLPTDPLGAWASVEADADPADPLSPGWLAVEMLVWDHRPESEAVLARFDQIDGNMLVEFKVHDFRANRAGRLGDLATAEHEVRRAVDTGELTGYPGSMAQSGLARVMAGTGRPAEAAATMAAVEPPADDLPLLIVAYRTGLGVAALAAEDWEDAVEHLQLAWSAAEKVGLGDLRALPFRGDLVDALIHVGRVDDAAAAADRIDELAVRCGAPTARLLGGLARADVLVAQGDQPAAIELAGDLQAQAASADMPIERARALLTLGTALRRSGRRRDARTTLTEARALADELRLVPLVRRIDGELDRLGARHDPFDLTPTEQRVAELVAQGRSNKQVAREMIVSLRTVESNLTRIYRKLGIRSRTELAATFRTRGADPD